MDENPERKMEVFFTPLRFSETARNFAKCDTIVLIFCESGSAIIEINYRKFNIVAGSTISLAYMDILSRLYVSRDFRGYCISLSPALVSVQMQKMNLSFLASARRNNVIRWEGEYARYIRHLFETVALCKEFGDYELFKATAVGQYFNFINLLNSYLQSNNLIDDGFKKDSPSSKKDYFMSFIKELVAHFKDSREVLFYADRLKISSNYLNEVCNNVCEHSAKEVIDSYISTHLKYELCNSKKTMQQLAEEYKFPNQSYMSRYYRRIMGETPTDTRRNNKNNITIF